MNRAYSIIEIKRVDEEKRIVQGIASTPRPDRTQDIVEPLGAIFKTPLPLFLDHQSHQQVGHVETAKADKNGITFEAKIQKIPEPGDAKDLVDKAWHFVKYGLRQFVSIGFRPLEDGRELMKNGGIRWNSWEWLELSLVSVPAQPDAVITQLKSLDANLLKSTTIKSIDTAQRAATGRELRSVALTPPGASGDPQRKSAQEGAKMKTIAEQISALENKRAASAARMDEVMQKALDEDRTTNADEQEDFDKLSVEVEAIDKDLVRLRQIERAKAFAAKPVMQIESAREGALARTGVVIPREYAMPAKKVEPQEYIWHALMCSLRSHFTKQSPFEVVKAEFGDNELAHGTRAVMQAITKAATAPADTVTSGWASQLVETIISDFFPALMPNSVYPALAARGGKFTFGTAGIVSMPTRSSTPTIAGSFIAQGAPIPVRQGAFTSITFTPKKLGVISTFTREIAEHSTPSIEGLIRQAVMEDTAVAIDTILLDNTAATTTRPAGLRNGVSATSATAGGGITALIGDIRGLTSALITGTSGNLRNPVWIMNPADVLAASLLQATAGGGEFPFKAELSAGTLQGYPVIQSSTVAADMMYLIDASDFVSVTGDTPRFDVSDQATLHMEDTTPLQIATGAQGSGVLATPTRSLWQTDSVGIRMLLDLNWGLRRTGVVAWTQTMTWN